MISWQWMHGNPYLSVVISVLIDWQTLFLIAANWQNISQFLFLGKYGASYAF